MSTPSSKPEISRAWDYRGRIVAEARRPDPESPTGFVYEFMAFDPQAGRLVRDDSLWDPMTDRNNTDLEAIPLADLKRRCAEQAAGLAGPTL